MANVNPSQLPFRYQVIDNTGMMTKPWSLWFTNFVNSSNNGLTFTPDSFIYSNASGALTAAPGSDGALLIGSSGGPPIVGQLTGTAHQVLVTNASGSITLSLPQSIDTTSSPKFNALTLSSLNPDGIVTVGTSGSITSTVAPSNGQLLIGSTGNAPVLGTLAVGSGLSVTNGAGSITLANTGVLENIAGTGISVSSATGNVTIANTGVTSLTAGSGISLSGSTGAITVSVNGTGVVTSITGTANEIIASSSTGNITLSTPQPIATTSSVTFANVTDSALTQNAFMYPGASGLLTSTSAATNGQLLIGSTGNAPVVANLTGTSNEVIVTNGAGSITLSLPQAIATTNSPTFAGLTLSGLTGYLYANGSSALTASTTIPNTSITGLGTMSTQNANSVAITGGSINATTIGASTASTGAFTTLSASTSATVPTVAQFDNSTNVADTAFVQRALGNFNNVYILGTATTLTASQAGGAFIINAGNVTLPLVSTVPVGASYYIRSSSPSISVLAQGSDTIFTTGGSVTSITIQGGDSIQIIKNGSQWEVAGGTASLQFAQSLGITAAQFDNSTKLSTTAFVQRAIGNKQTTYAYNTSQTITLSQAGSVIQSYAGGLTFTMPLANTIPEGAEFDFVNNSGGTLTVTVNNISTDAFIVGVSSATSITLQIGDSLSIVGTGNSYMFVTGGSAILQYSSTHYNNPTFSGTISGMPGRLLAIRTLSNGTYTPTTGTNTVLVKMQAPGGAGGGTAATSSGQYAAGSSGGAGAYVEALFAVGTLSGSTVSLGTAGAGSAGATGGAGSSATFGSAISCPGGSGGFAGSAVTGPSATLGPAATGSPTVTGGTTLLAVPGIGGAAGVIFTAGSLQGIFAGGSTPIGQGSQPKWGFGANVGQGYGWGGGGYNAGASTSAQAGASGGPGYCEVWEFS